MNLDSTRLWTGAVGAGIAAIWASLGLSVQVLLGLMVADYMLGVVIALLDNQYSGNIAFRGVARKAATLLVVGCASAVQPLLADLPAGPVVAGFYCGSELISVLGNAQKLGVPVPQWVLDIGERLMALFGSGNGGAVPRGPAA